MKDIKTRIFLDYKFKFSFFSLKIFVVLFL